MTRDRKIRIDIEGRRAELLGAAVYRESLKGSGLRLRLPAEAAPTIKPGAKITLVVKEDGEEPIRAVLWVTSVEQVWRGRRGECEVTAADALTICSVGRQFVSHLGGRPLHELVRDVLAGHPLRPQDATAPAGPSPDVTIPWLLQCGEKARKFLARHADNVAGLVYPSRDGVAVGTRADGPALAVADVELKPGVDCEALRVARRLPAPSCATRWVNPESREVQVVGGGSKTLWRRTLSVEKPAPDTWRDERESKWTRRLNAATRTPRLQLGTKVRIARHEDEWRVTRIVHELTPAGAYRNEIRCVPVAEWGLRSIRRARSLAGFFQATVHRNDDPDRLGRIQAVLAEDAAQHPTPWLSALTPLAGKHAGWHCLPEVEDPVVVALESDCPEAPYYVAAIRDRNQPFDPGMCSSDNSPQGLIVPGDLHFESAGSFDIEGKQHGAIKARQKLAIDAGVQVDIG